MRIGNWDAERKRGSAQPQELRIGQIQFVNGSILNSQFLSEKTFYVADEDVPPAAGM